MNLEVEMTPKQPGEPRVSDERLEGMIRGRIRGHTPGFWERSEEAGVFLDLRDCRRSLLEAQSREAALRKARLREELLKYRRLDSSVVIP